MNDSFLPLKMVGLSEFRLFEPRFRVFQVSVCLWEIIQLTQHSYGFLERYRVEDNKQRYRE